MRYYAKQEEEKEKSDFMNTREDPDMKFTLSPGIFPTTRYKIRSRTGNL